VGAVFTVVASPDLGDWDIALGKTWPREYEVDLSQGLCLPDLGTSLPPKMFFRWRLAVEQTESCCQGENVACIHCCQFQFPVANLSSCSHWNWQLAAFDFRPEIP